MNLLISNNTCQQIAIVNVQEREGLVEHGIEQWMCVSTNGLPPLPCLIPIPDSMAQDHTLYFLVANFC